MRRDYFALSVDEVDPDDHGTPTLRVDFDGPTEELTDRLHGTDGPLDARSVDVSYRLLSDDEFEDGADGVLSVTDRVTGAFVLELDAAADDVAAFVRAAREHCADGDADRYRLVVEADGERLADYEKRTLLVYDADGGLLRSRSLIPSGVEL